MQFFQKNKEQSNQNLNSYNTKDEDSHYFSFSSLSPLARLNAYSTIDLCTGNHFCFFEQPKGWVYLCFSCFCLTRDLSKSCMDSKRKMLGYYTGVSPLSRAT